MQLSTLANSKNMINLLLLSIFINLTSLLAANEVNKLPLESSPTFGSYVQSVPRLNIDYNALTPDKNRIEYSQPLQNYESDDSSYCPHAEILANIINELKNLPQGSEKIKEVLKNYYIILENALNSRNSVQSFDVTRSKNELNFIESIAQKLKIMNDKNAKIKISIEYELPKMHKTICDKLCNDLINFEKGGNSPAIKDVNYASEPEKKKNKIMTFLQNYRPDNILQEINKPVYLYPPNSDSPPSNPLVPNMTMSNLLQVLPVLQDPTKNNVNGISLQNLPALTQKAKGISDPDRSKYLLTPLLNPIENPNSHSLQNLSFLFPSLKGNTNPATSQNLSPPLLQSKDTSNKFPFENLIPVQQSFRGPLNSYPFQNFTPLKNSLLNVVPLPQNPTEPEVSYPIQNLPQQLQRLKGNIKEMEMEEFAKKLNEHFLSNENSQYQHESQKQVQYNKNAVQYMNKNNIVTPRKYENPKSDIYPNSWSQPNYMFTNNKYSNNEKLLQEKLIQFYNQQKQLMGNFVPETTTPGPAYLYQLNANALPSIKQYESKKLNMDSSSVQTHLDQYNQYLQSVNNLIYPQTNSGTGHYLLNQKIPYSSQNLYPFSNGQKYLQYNPYMKNYNQLATQYNTPNRLALYPNLYYYSNPNLGLTNSVKGTQENYGVQFQNLHRLLAVSNLDKLNSVSNKNGIIELTYKLTHTKPAVEPFYYVKYKLPYNEFLLNYNKLLIQKPNLRNNPHLLYKNLLSVSNITASSSELKSLDKDELLKLVSANGTLVTARVLDANDTAASEQIKIIQQLNVNMPLEEIVKTDSNITKISDPSNVSLMNYLRDRPNYLNELQKRIAMNRNYLNTYNAQANQNNNQYVRYPNYLANRLPTVGNNNFQNKQNYPYSKYALNPLLRYYGYQG